MALNKTVKWVGYNTRDPLPVRKQPNAKADECTFSPIPKNASVNVCDTKSGWLYVDMDGMYGYVSAKYVKFKQPKRITPSKTVKWIGKTTEAVTARKWAASYESAIISIPKSAAVSVCDSVDGYWYVKYSDKYGFVPIAKVKYSSEPKKQDEKVKEFLAAVKATQEYARKHSYIWADSRSTVPASDGKISCDRLVARALWDLGYTDQIKGGIALGRDFEGYLIKHGFKRSTSMAAAKAGSVLVVMNPSGSSRHVFVIASRSGDRYTRYDCGSTEWIRSKQPLQGLWMSRLIAIYNIG